MGWDEGSLTQRGSGSGRDSCSVPWEAAGALLPIMQHNAPDLVRCDGAEECPGRGYFKVVSLEGSARPLYGKHQAARDESNGIKKQQRGSDRQPLQPLLCPPRLRVPATQAVFKPLCLTWLPLLLPCLS